jgi:hypothetical protein
MSFAIRVEPDPDRPIGHARLILQGQARHADKGRFALTRDGYARAHLGPGGWQVSEVQLTPLACTRRGEDLVITIGPAVIRHLEPGPLRLSLAGADETPLFWPDDIAVFDGDLPDAAPPTPDPDATRILRPPPPPAAAPPPAPAPPVPPVTTPAAPATAAPLASAALPTPSPAQPQAASSAAAPRRAPMLAWLALLAIVLAGAGAGAWFALRPNPQPPTPLAPPMTVAPPSILPAPPPPPALSWPDGTDALSIRQLVERAPNAEALADVARRRQAAGRHDDALVLFEEAAERGHAPALTALARLYDPVDFVPGRPFRAPDPRNAARYYRDAIQKGDAAAAAPRAALRAWLEARSAGNAALNDALTEFWP